MADKLTRKEFRALPISERRKLLEEQANNPEVIAYYEGLNEADRLDRPDREKIEIAPVVTFNLRLSSHDTYLMKVQRDADHAFYQDQILSLIDPEAIKRQVAEEIFGDIIKTYPGVSWLYNQEKWQALKGKYISNPD